MNITSADRMYLLSPAEIEHFPIEKYQHKMTPEHVPYIFFKTYNETTGFRGLYGTILISPGGSEVKYLCITNILPSIDQARDLFNHMTPDPFPRDFGLEVTVNPKIYHADNAYLYKDDTYFHLVLQSSRVVYSVLIDGAAVEETQVRKELREKMDYLMNHLDDMIIRSAQGSTVQD